jgi:hypothetical protein
MAIAAIAAASTFTTLEATASAAAPRASVTKAGVQTSNYVNCGYSYDDCVHTRSNYVRYYRVSDIYWWPWDCTGPGGCPAGTYYFYYYT